MNNEKKLTIINTNKLQIIMISRSCPKARANNAAGAGICSIMHETTAFTLFPRRPIQCNIIVSSVQQNTVIVLYSIKYCSYNITWPVQFNTINNFSIIQSNSIIVQYQTIVLCYQILYLHYFLATDHAEQQDT